MNLDDLRAELDAQANDVDPHSTGRLAGIRAKIAQRRRRKAGATLAGSVLAVGAIIAVPVVSQLSAGPEPAEDGRGPFPEKIDGDTKIAEAVGDRGETKVTLEFTPDDTDFLLDVDCDDLGSEVARARVNGRRTVALCGSMAPGVTTGEVGGVASPSKVRRLWERFGVRAGEPVTVTLRVMDETLTPARSIEGSVGVAAYAMTGERRNVLGVAAPEEKTVGGATYALAEDGYVVAPTRPHGSQQGYVPESDEPTLVTYGAASGRKLVRGSIDGVQGALPTTGGVSSELLPGGDARTVGVDNMSDDKWAKLVIAYYTPVETDEEPDTDALEIPEKTRAGDPLVASEVGEAGEAVVRTTFTPGDANLAVGKACTLAGKPSDDVWVRMTMNGREVLSGECQPYHGETYFGERPGPNRAAWQDREVVENEPVNVVIRARAKDGSAVSLDDIRLGFGAYERSPRR